MIRNRQRRVNKIEMNGTPGIVCSQPCCRTVCAREDNEQNAKIKRNEREKTGNLFNRLIDVMIGLSLFDVTLMGRDRDTITGKEEFGSRKQQQQTTLLSG